jgi:hypothetical protein
MRRGDWQAGRALAALHRGERVTMFWEDDGEELRSFDIHSGKTRATHTPSRGWQLPARGGGWETRSWELP